MDLEELWQKSLKETHILRARISKLETFGSTTLLYIFLAESLVNIGNTVVRKGKIDVERPLIVLPKPLFQGFDLKEELQIDENDLRTFFLVRGVSFPALKYKHETSTIEVYEGDIDKAIEEYSKQLEEKEDTEVGLIVGPADCWQLSVLIYVGNLVLKSAPEDIKRLLKQKDENQNM